MAGQTLRYCALVRAPRFDIRIDAGSRDNYPCGFATLSAQPPAYAARPPSSTRASNPGLFVVPTPGFGFVEPGPWMVSLSVGTDHPGCVAWYNFAWW